MDDKDQCIRCRRWVRHDDDDMGDGYCAGEGSDDGYICARCITLGEENAIAEDDAAFIKEMGLSESDPAFEDDK